MNWGIRAYVGGNWSNGSGAGLFCLNLNNTVGTAGTNIGFLTAGYPCQPFSQAGKRLGEKDPRHLWPHVRRILGEVQAPFLLAENVLGHVSLGLDHVREDLLAMGYEVEAGIFSAAEVGAPHWRKRLFILAYADSELVGNPLDWPWR